MRILGLLLLVATATAPLPALAQDAAPAEAPKKLRKPDIPYGPTPHRKVKDMLELAGVKPGDIVYDLGSGDGRIPIAAVKDFGAKAIGFDINPKWVARAKQNAKLAGLDGKVEFRNEDIFTADFSDATVITMFLWPSVNHRLMPKLLQLKPGTRIVSYYHDGMEEWKPVKVLEDKALLIGDIYMWIVPEHK